MRGHNKPPVEGEIVKQSQVEEIPGIDPRFAAIGRAAMKAAGVVLVKEAEWDAADEAIAEMYDALLAAKVFIELMRTIAPFHPEMNRIADMVKDVNDEIEAALCACERYQEEGK